MCAIHTIERVAAPADDSPVRERVELPQEFCCWREWAYSDVPENEPIAGS